MEKRYDIDWDLIGNHVVSKTEWPVKYTIATNLTEYEVCHNTTKEPIEVNSRMCATRISKTTWML